MDFSHLHISNRTHGRTIRGNAKLKAIAAILALSNYNHYLELFTAFKVIKVICFV